jgi:hypothetical protein
MAWTTSGEEAAVSDAASRRARGDVLYDRDGASADECDGHGVGAHAVARGSGPWKRTDFLSFVCG